MRRTAWAAAGALLAFMQFGAVGFASADGAPVPVTSEPEGLPEAALGRWEPFSNGALSLGEVTLSVSSLTFGKAGSADLTMREGYAEVRWTNPRPAVSDLCGGSPPQSVQIREDALADPAKLEIAFFSTREKPAADPSEDFNLCAIQTWSRSN